MFRLEDERNELWQWDINRRLVIEDDSITEVHFCNKTDDCSLVVTVYTEGGKRLADIPNILLTNYWPINVYGYSNGCYTKQHIALKVKARSKPADYVYTETEAMNYNTLDNRITALEAVINSMTDVSEVGL